MLFDQIIAFIGITTLSPVLVLLAILVRLTSSGPAFYVQERIGRNGKPFLLLKFRTMTVAKPQSDTRQITVTGDARITPLGHFLRRYKLDELPQLINVLSRRMRLVGPRPEVAKYVAYYRDEQRRVLSVHPGITDIATLYYRNESDELAAADDPETYYIETVLPRKLRLNLQYIDSRTFLSDIRVILLTALVSVSPTSGADYVRNWIERRYLSDSSV